MPPAPVSVASTWDARPLAVCGVSGSRDRVEFSLRIRRPFLKSLASNALGRGRALAPPPPRRPAIIRMPTGGVGDIPGPDYLSIKVGKES